MHGRLLAWAVVGGLAGIGSAAVNPRPGGDPATSVRQAQEAGEYARSILDVITLAQQQYVQPVPRANLAEAAVAGLYEAARQPPPGGLRQEFEAARTTAEFSRILIRERLALGADDALRGNRALMASILALPRALDPHCGPSSARDIYSFYESSPFGFGLEFVNLPVPRTNVNLESRDRRLPPRSPHPDGHDKLAAPLRVKNVIPGSPAQRAGLRPGDLITAINGEPTVCRDRPTCLQLFYPSSPDASGGVSPPALRLDVLRADRPSPLPVKLLPDYFVPESVFGARRGGDGKWDYVHDAAAGLGYLRLGPIIASNGSSRVYSSAIDFYEVVTGLRDAGVRGLVLDLRWCPGGYLDPAIQIAQALLPDPPRDAESDDVPRRPPEIAILTSRDKPPQPVEWQPPLGEPVGDLTLVVLINGETSGGGEMIAAALQDHRRAVLAGDRTRGKASVQRPLAGIPPGIDFRITTGIFHRSTGKNLHRFPQSTPADDWGVRPDAGRAVPVSAEAARLLKEMWTAHALRPALSREALAADDPEADPQLRAALDMLRALVKKPPPNAS